MKTATVLRPEIKDFLLKVALGNSEPDSLADDASELLTAFGVAMTEITDGQYVERE